MSWKIIYHPDITLDLKRLPQNIKKRIQNAIEERLCVDPFKYGSRLRRSLHGFWKLRVGDYRVIYQLNREGICILIIGHRKEVYEKIHARGN